MIYSFIHWAFYSFIFYFDIVSLPSQIIYYCVRSWNQLAGFTLTKKLFQQFDRHLIWLFGQRHTSASGYQLIFQKIYQIEIYQYLIHESKLP